MVRSLDIMNEQLELGQTKVICSDGGKFIDYVELLFSQTTKVQFAPSNNRKMVRLSVSDNTLELPQLDCLITKEILRNFILSLKNIYNELIDEENINGECD